MASIPLLPLNGIKQILDSSNIEDEVKSFMILALMSQNEEVIPYILTLLQKERKKQHKLIVDLNLNLARTTLYLNSFAEEPKTQLKQDFNRAWVIEQTRKLYKENEGKIVDLFNNFKTQ